MKMKKKDFAKSHEEHQTHTPHPINCVLEQSCRALTSSKTSLQLSSLYQSMGRRQKTQGSGEGNLN